MAVLKVMVPAAATLVTAMVLPPGGSLVGYPKKCVQVTLPRGGQPLPEACVVYLL